MNQELFVSVWNNLYKWNDNNKSLFHYGIDISKYDAVLYNSILLLLRSHFNDAQMDFFLWTIFGVENTLEIENNKIIFDNAETCWEYINKIEINTEDEQQI